MVGAARRPRPSAAAPAAARPAGARHRREPDPAGHRSPTTRAAWEQLAALAGPDLAVGAGRGALARRRAADRRARRRRSPRPRFDRAARPRLAAHRRTPRSPRPPTTAPAPAVAQRAGGPPASRTDEADARASTAGRRTPRRRARRRWPTCPSAPRSARSCTPCSRPSTHRGRPARRAARPRRGRARPPRPGRRASTADALARGAACPVAAHPARTAGGGLRWPTSPRATGSPSSTSSSRWPAATSRPRRGRGHPGRRRPRCCAAPAGRRPARRLRRRARATARRAGRCAATSPAASTPCCGCPAAAYVVVDYKTNWLGPVARRARRPDRARTTARRAGRRR